MRMVFAALANDDRLVIVDALLRDQRPAGSGWTITEVAHATGLSRFSASRHLTILRDAGVVSAVRNGTSIRHRVDLEILGRVEDWAYARAIHRDN